MTKEKKNLETKSSKQQANNTDRDQTKSSETNQLAIAAVASIIVGGLLSLCKLSSDKKSK